MFKNQKAFTLIEMLIVLMIVSVLMILIIPNLGSKSKDVQHKGCEALVSVVQTQIDAFYLEKYTYPKSLDELVSENYIRKNQTYCSSSDSKLIYVASTGKVSAPNE
jgi:competence protein ComGC